MRLPPTRVEKYSLIERGFLERKGPFLPYISMMIESERSDTDKRAATIELREFDLAKGEELLPQNFPEAHSLSAAFMFEFVPRPSVVLPPEFAYVAFQRP